MATALFKEPATVWRRVGQVGKEENRLRRDVVLSLFDVAGPNHGMIMRMLAS